jgi:hypothetical protein
MEHLLYERVSLIAEICLRIMQIFNGTPNSEIEALDSCPVT